MTKLHDSIPLYLRVPRNTLWLCIALVLLVAIAVLNPVQLPVVLYKMSLIAIAVVMGYWIDRALFPYARPDGYLATDWRYGTKEPEFSADYMVVQNHMSAFVAATVRRGLIVSATIIAVSVGL